VHVFISDDARADLGEIWDFLAQSSIEAADRVTEELIGRALAIGHAPYAAPVMAGRERHRTRRVNVRSWGILYEISAEGVEVLNFVQGRNNPSRLPPPRR
jgi:plasmid stabilization system protein ParE